MGQLPAFTKQKSRSKPKGLKTRWDNLTSSGKFSSGEFSPGEFSPGEFSPGEFHQVNFHQVNFCKVNFVKEQSNLLRNSLFLAVRWDFDTRQGWGVGTSWPDGSMQMNRDETA